MTPAGRRDRKIVVEQIDEGPENSMGEPAGGWIPLHSFMARVVYGRSDERRQAARESGEQVASFRVLRSARSRAVTPEHRISFDGAVWDITGTPEYGRREIEFIAVRRTS